MAKATASSIAPQLSVIITCADFQVDERTERRSVIGIFDCLVPKMIPTTLDRIWLYVAFTDCRGNAQIRVKLTDSDDELVLAEMRDEDNSISPKHTIDRAFLFENIRFPSYGEYTFQIEVNGHHLGEKRFEVTET